MRTTFFKHRGRFDFSPHPFDVGRPFFWSKKYEDNHFLYRLFKIEGSDYAAFYKYHLEYFLSAYPDSNEKEFFDQVWGIVKDHIKRLTLKDNYSTDHPGHIRDKKILQAFQNHLTSIDQWNTDKSKDIIITEKESEILNLKNELAQLKRELKEARSLETTDRVKIAEGYLPVVIDLFNQFQELTLPDGKELMLSQTQTIWVKMICKYFEHGKSQINPETVRRYFPSDKRTPGTKYSPVPSQFKLFKITTAKKRS
jgi:hypothetical protein